MPDFDNARDALARTVRKVFPRAQPTQPWKGVEGWAIARPAAAVASRTAGAYDPTKIVIGIADRKAGPTIYYLDPGDYHALETHRALLEEAGLKLGRGCIYLKRGAPLPTKALERLFRAAKARDAAAKPTRSPVDAYLAKLPATQRAGLQKLRRQVHAAVPDVTEKMAYGIPTFVHRGKNLVHMAAFREHLSFFPGASGVALALQKELRGFTLGKGTIQFTPRKPIPARLVKKIVKERAAALDARLPKRQ